MASGSVYGFSVCQDCGSTNYPHLIDEMQNVGIVTYNVTSYIEHRDDVTCELFGEPVDHPLSACVLIIF